MSINGDPPSVFGAPFLGCIAPMRSHAANLLLSLYRDHGDFVRFRLGPEWNYFLAHPDYVRHVLVENSKNYSKGTRIFKRLGHILGRGLITSEGDLWRRQRRLIQPAVHRKKLTGFTEMMKEVAKETAQVWEFKAATQEKVDIWLEMNRITLEVVSRALFGQTVPEQAQHIAHAVDAIQNDMSHRMYAVVDVPLSIPTPNNRRLLAAIKEIEAVVYHFIKKQRAGKAPASSMLDMLVTAAAEEHSEMSDAQLRDEVVTMFLAGNETTANLLSWTWHLLSRNPQVERRLADEFFEVLGDRDPDFKDLARLPYARCVLLESMRLYPPVWGIPRIALEDDHVGGYTIPKGSEIWVSPYVTHRHHSVWENPEGFDPDRFAGNKQKRLPRCSYFPFGAGARLCVGNDFVLLEATMVLAILVRKFRLHLIPGHSAASKPKVTLMPAEGLIMRIQPQLTRDRKDIQAAPPAETGTEGKCPFSENVENSPA